MRILHILASNKFSGAENVVCQIINMFRAAKDIEMFYCSPDGQIREALAERNINFVPITALNHREVKSVIRDISPDCIHAHDMRASFIAARFSDKVSFISHIHGNFEALNKITAKSLAYTYAALKSKQIFWVSASSYDAYVFKNIIKDKSDILPNVIDIAELYRKALIDSENYNYDVVFLGRLTEAKNPRRLINVLKLLIDRNPDVRIAIIGTGELEQTTKLLACQLGIQDNIVFLGFLSNPLKILHDSKVMIMTSVREGTPMCALEAMALGVPIVSTPTDGMCDIVINGETGYLSDDDSILADRLGLIINNQDIRLLLSENSKKNSKAYDNNCNYRKKIQDAYYKQN